MNESTPGQRSLTDLTIMLYTLDIKHPDIVQGWIDKITAELNAAPETAAERDRLHKINAALTKACEAYLKDHDDDIASLCRDAGIAVSPCDCPLCEQARAVIKLAKGEA